MSFEAFDVRVVELLDVGFFDGSVHAFGLAVGPGMVGLGQLVLDAVLVADTIEDVGAEIAPGRAVAVLGQIGEGHAVVGQHGMDGVGENASTTPRRSWRRSSSRRRRGTRHQRF